VSRKNNTTEKDEVPGGAGILRQRRVVRAIRRAYLSMCRCGNATFSPNGMTTDQYALIRAVQRNEGMRQSELGEELFADANTITAMVALLERRGFLRREICPGDGRARRLYVTSDGNRMMRRLSSDWEPMRQKLLDCFEGEAGVRALEIMERICEVMTEGRREILQRQSSKTHRETGKKTQLESVKLPKPKAKTTASV
jgi:DNA-binding MarR family transcriptional regulator